MENKKKKRKTRKKREHGISLIIIAALALAVISLFSLNFNLPLEPSNENEFTTNTIVVFRWLGFADQIIIDNNPKFESPKIIEATPGKSYAITELAPGKYYWKTNGVSPIQSFAIETKVAIEIKNNTAKNTGNIASLFDIFKNALTGQVILHPNQEIKLDEETEKVIAQENE